jgi:hypothetical protein
MNNIFFKFEISSHISYAENYRGDTEPHRIKYYLQLAVKNMLLSPAGA